MESVDTARGYLCPDLGRGCPRGLVRGSWSQQGSPRHCPVPGLLQSFHVEAIADGPPQGGLRVLVRVGGGTHSMPAQTSYPPRCLAV